MKKIFILLTLLINFNFCALSQFVKYDTVSDKSQYFDLIKHSQIFFTLLKEKNLKEIKQNMIGKVDATWLNEEVTMISDSLKKYGMPNSEKFCIIKDTITTITRENAKKKTEFIEVVYFLNTIKYEKDKTLSIELTFSKDLGLNKIESFHLDRPINTDALLEEFYKLYPDSKPK